MQDTDLIEQLFSNVMQLKKLISQQTFRTHEDKVATMLQFSALNFLKEQENLTLGDLAEFLKLSKSSATQLIERLVKMKLVKRVSDKQDRRLIRLKISSEGEAEFITIKKEIMLKMRRFLSTTPEKDIKELIRIHTNLIETLKKEGL